MRLTLAGLYLHELSDWIFRICGVAFQSNTARETRFVVYDAKGTPREDVCRDFMLILAASEIVPARDGEGGLVAELAD